MDAQELLSPQRKSRAALSVLSPNMKRSESLTPVKSVRTPSRGRSERSETKLLYKVMSGTKGTVAVNGEPKTPCSTLKKAHMKMDASNKATTATTPVRRTPAKGNKDKSVTSVTPKRAAAAARGATNTNSSSAFTPQKVDKMNIYQDAETREKGNESSNEEIESKIASASDMMEKIEKIESGKKLSQNRPELSVTPRMMGKLLGATTPGTGSKGQSSARKGQAPSANTTDSSISSGSYGNYTSSITNTNSNSNSLPTSNHHVFSGSRTYTVSFPPGPMGLELEPIIISSHGERQLGCRVKDFYFNPLATPVKQQGLAKLKQHSMGSTKGEGSNGSNDSNGGDADGGSEEEEEDDDFMAYLEKTVQCGDVVSCVNGASVLSLSFQGTLDILRNLAHQTRVVVFKDISTHNTHSSPAAQLTPKKEQVNVNQCSDLSNSTSTSASHQYQYQRQYQYQQEQEQKQESASPAGWKIYPGTPEGTEGDRLDQKMMSSRTPPAATTAASTTTRGGNLDNIGIDAAAHNRSSGLLLSPRAIRTLTKGGVSTSTSISTSRVAYPSYEIESYDYTSELLGTGTHTGDGLSPVFTRKRRPVGRRRTAHDMVRPITPEDLKAVLRQVGL